MLYWALYSYKYIIQITAHIPFNFIVKILNGYIACTKEKALNQWWSLHVGPSCTGDK